MTYEEWLENNGYEEHLSCSFTSIVCRKDCMPIYKDEKGHKFIGLSNKKIFEAGYNAKTDDLKVYNKALEECNGKLIKENEKLKLNKECSHCNYSDSPCMPDDYSKNENGYCSHYLNVFDCNRKLHLEITEAKEIIRALLKHTHGQHLNTQNDFDLYLGRIKEAEQFLSEMEK